MPHWIVPSPDDQTHCSHCGKPLIDYPRYISIESLYKPLRIKRLAGTAVKLDIAIPVCKKCHRIIGCGSFFITVIKAILVITGIIICAWSRTSADFGGSLALTLVNFTLGGLIITGAIKIPRINKRKLKSKYPTVRSAIHQLQELGWSSTLYESDFDNCSLNVNEFADNIKAVLTANNCCLIDKATHLEVRLNKTDADTIMNDNLSKWDFSD